MQKVDEFDTDEPVTEAEWPRLQAFLDQYAPGLGAELGDAKLREKIPQLKRMVRSDYQRVKAGKRPRYLPTVKPSGFALLSARAGFIGGKLDIAMGKLGHYTRFAGELHRAAIDHTLTEADITAAKEKAIAAGVTAAEVKEMEKEALHFVRLFGPGE